VAPDVPWHGTCSATNALQAGGPQKPMTERRVPVIDVSDWFGTDETAKDRLCARIDTACRDLGFLVVTGHGVDMHEVRRIHDVAYEFFSRPFDEKSQIAFGKISTYAGYGASGLDRLDATDGDRPVGDLKESFGMGPFGFPGTPYYTGPSGARFFQPNAWPDAPADMRETFEGFYSTMERFTGALMSMFARALSLDADYFEKSIDRHITHLNIQHYPAQDVPPAPGQLRAGAHTDFGSVTVLHPGDRPEGLQVMDADGTWHDVVVPQDAFVINLGDLMARWTNDVWRSTMHRVIVPSDPAAARAPRQTLTTFVRPNYDAVIACIETCTAPDNPPRYPPISSGEHYDTKIALLRGEKAA